MKQRFSALFLRIAGFMEGLILLKTGNSTHRLAGDYDSLKTN